MICDEDGYVVICSCDNLTCDHVGKQVPESYRREMLREGVYYEKNVHLADIYDDARFLAGQAVVNDQTGNLVGFDEPDDGLYAAQQHVLHLHGNRRAGSGAGGSDIFVALSGAPPRSDGRCGAPLRLRRGRLILAAFALCRYCRVSDGVRSDAEIPTSVQLQ